MHSKKQKPPIHIGGPEKLRAMDRPRYMNVPSPAPCHINVAGVGKQSVWGLRFIACVSLLLSHGFRNSSIPKWWWQAVRLLRITRQELHDEQHEIGVSVVFEFSGPNYGESLALAHDDRIAFQRSTSGYVAIV